MFSGGQLVVIGITVLVLVVVCAFFEYFHERWEPDEDEGDDFFRWM